MSRLDAVSARRVAPLGGLAPDELLVHEIYASIQGESSHAGRPCTFVRTTACNLRCSYCDTRHAFYEGTRVTLDGVRERVDALGHNLVEITGGEPLLQPAVLPLMQRLCDAGYEVLLETSGSLPLRDVDARVRKIVDMKTPSSGEAGSNDEGNLALLLPHDEVKLVISDRSDYDWSRELLARHRLAQRCTVLMGPVWGALEPRVLAQWIIDDRLPVRFQVQLHKLLWGPDARGV